MSFTAEFGKNTLSKIMGFPAESFSEIRSRQGLTIAIKVFFCSEDEDEYSVSVNSNGEVVHIKSSFAEFDAAQVKYLLNPPETKPVQGIGLKAEPDDEEQ